MRVYIACGFIYIHAAACNSALPFYSRARVDRIKIENCMLVN